MTNAHMQTRAIPVLGFAGVGRATFAVEYETAITRRALNALQTLGWPIAGTDEVFMDSQAARNAGERIQQEHADILIIAHASFADASAALELARAVNRPILLWAFREPGPVGDRLWLNSLCGANIAANALQRENYVTHYVYGDPEEPAALQEIAAFAGACAVNRKLRRAKISVIGQAPTGFYSSQFDELALAQVIGPTIVQKDLGTLFAAAEQADSARVQAITQQAIKDSPSLQALNPQDVQRFGQTYCALKDAAAEDHSDALAVRCWPEFPSQFQVMPCAAMGRIAEDGVIASCETDVYGAVTQLMLQYFSGKPPLMADVVAMDDMKNTLTLWHCGNAAISLARNGDEPVMAGHCNRKIGVAGNFPIRPGHVTVARLGVSHTGFRLLAVEGELLDVPENRFQGNSAVFRPIGSAKSLLDTMMAQGLEHHVIFTEGSFMQELRFLAQMWNIPIISQ